MSQIEELVEYVSYISKDAKVNSLALAQCAEKMERTAATFSNIVKGTKDTSADTVGAAFRKAEKELYLASKALIEAAAAGEDWCDGHAPTLQLKKVRR